MKRKLLLSFLLSMSMTGFAITKIVNTVGDTFSPPDTSITPSDSVQFNIGSGHDVAEVDFATYQANGTTANGGFFFNFGTTTGIVNGSQLSLGTHYFVCQAHAFMGMKGTITVTALGVNDFQLAKSFSVFPNPTIDFINVKANGDLNNLPYTLIDQNGRVVCEGKLEDVSNSIDVRQLSAGIYFLQVGDDKRQIFKLMKK